MHDSVSWRIEVTRMCQCKKYNGRECAASVCLLLASTTNGNRKSRVPVSNVECCFRHQRGRLTPETRMPLLFSFLQQQLPRLLGAGNGAKDVSREQTGKGRSLSVLPDWMIRGRKTSYKRLTSVAPFSRQVSIPGMRIPILISWPISYSSLMV